MVAILNGEKVEAPECWDNLSTKQYEDIVRWEPETPLAERNFLKLLAILTNKDFKLFKDTAENEVTLWNIVGWVTEQPFPSMEVPKVLQIGEKIIDVPREIVLLSTGQNIHARQEIDKGLVLTDKETGKLIDCSSYAILTAIYLQPLYDNAKFNFRSAQALAKKIEQMPITLIRPIGFFLLSRVLKHGKTSVWQWLSSSISRIRRRGRLLPT